MTLSSTTGTGAKSGAQDGVKSSGCAETVGALAGRNATHALVVLYNQAPRGAPIQACSVDVRSHTTRDGNSASPTLWRIDDDHANPKARWEALGAPQWPTGDQNRQIYAASLMLPQPALVSAQGAVSVSVPPQGVAALSFPLA